MLLARMASLGATLRDCLCLAFDVLTVKARDVVIPRAIKRRLPFLSCRRYSHFGDVRCWPARKYSRPTLFLFACRHYDVATRECCKRR
jgi:hypothetical protein